MVSEAEVDQYLETVLWAETDEDDELLSRNYNIFDFTQAARNQALVELSEFYAEAEHVFYALGEEFYELDISSWPHDFWLNRNGYGTGFWDREEKYGAAAEALSVLAKRAGERSVEVQIYDEGEDGEQVGVTAELSFFPPQRTGG
jgi:hypothetical protein